MTQPQFEINAKEFAVFYKAISMTDPELKKSLRKRLLSLAKPIVDDVKHAEMNIPSKRGKVGDTRKKKGETLGLRASLAAATKADFNGTGRGAVLHIRVSGTRFVSVSGRSRTLPYYMEGRRKRAWRHPVYGNRNNWIEQEKHPFLNVTVFKHEKEFVNEVSKAVEDTLNYIDSKVKKGGI
jgi:hypothetical protein